jgi:ABC-2 type transport system permease protein
MWLRLYRFEVGYWLRSWMVWIFLLLIFGASLWQSTKSDGGIGRWNCAWNAGYVIEFDYAFFSLSILLLATVFVNSAANRDFACRTDQIIFSTPIRKFDYLTGRFLGAATIAFLPTLGVSLGILAAKHAPWAKDGYFLAVNWHAHAHGLLLFALPNVFFIAAILFAVGMLTRSSAMSFVSAVAVLTGYIISRSYMSDLKDERIGALLDPFGIAPFHFMTRYWTAADKNRLVVALPGLMLWNRLLWVGIGLVILAWAYRRFRFSPRERRAAGEEADDTPMAPAWRPTSELHPTWQTQFVEILKLELRAIFKTVTFWVLLACSLALTLSQVIGKATEGYSNPSFPVTYKILELLQGGSAIFSMVIILYFAGAVVWRERDAGAEELIDALPVPPWLSYAAKFSAVVLPMFLFQLVGMLAGVVVQASHGYYRFQLDVYVVQLLLLDFPGFVFLAVLAFFSHVISPNKYVAYFLFPAFIIADIFVWEPLNVGTLMVKFGQLPSGTYSDFFGWGPYRAGMLWFTLYWAAFSALLALATILLWRNGCEIQWRHRFRDARLGLSGRTANMATALAAVFLAIAAFVFYNTRILQHPGTDQDVKWGNARYEKAYKRYQNIPFPKIVSLKYSIDLQPENASMTVRCGAVIRNQTAAPIDQFHLNYHAGADVEITVQGAKLVKRDFDLGYVIYSFSPPMQPGESRSFEYVVKQYTRGFDVSVVSNGIFFNNLEQVRIGYQRNSEVDDHRDKFGLPAREELPEPERNCTVDCANNYIDHATDWVPMETVISTAPDQIAVAPGSLVREWTAHGRRYFEYKLDHPSIGIASFTSARYQVSRELWNGISIEVYHLKEHPWNVPRMRKAIRSSLAYYTNNFGPYAHRQARILEFPRVVAMAQSFPGTMPYSESIGFIANLEGPEAIDHVFFYVAHEMAHQWWAPGYRRRPARGDPALGVAGPILCVHGHGEGIRP